MQEIKLTELQLRRAESLNTGKVIIAYRDGTTIRMETEEGDDPYVWRHNGWVAMKA